VLPALRIFCRRLGSLLGGLFDHRGRDGVVPAADGDQHRLRDGQGKRQVDAEGSALAGGRTDLDAPAKAGGFVAHYVHADAATGERGDFLGGGETRMQDQLRQRRFIGFVVCSRAGRVRQHDGCVSARS
jgi:hypothetical protein